MKTRVALFLAVFGALAAVTACKSRSSAPPSPAASGTPNASASAAAADPVQVGKPPPDFTALTYKDETVTISTLKGRPVVIYFCQKDASEDCTKEACAFRDAWNDISATHAVLIGITADTDAAHKKFAEKWKLPFILISDEDTGLAQKLGVPVTILGTDLEEARQTFVIGADGNVKKIYRDVDITQHVSQVLADLKS